MSIVPGECRGAPIGIAWRAGAAQHRVARAIRCRKACCGPMSTSAPGAWSPHMDLWIARILTLGPFGLRAPASARARGRYRRPGGEPASRAGGCAGVRRPRRTGVFGGRES